MALPNKDRKCGCNGCGEKPNPYEPGSHGWLSYEHELANRRWQKRVDAEMKKWREEREALRVLRSKCILASLLCLGVPFAAIQWISNYRAGINLWW